MRTSFVCCICNEAVLKAFFKMHAEELKFSKVVAMASEIEDAAKAAKIITYSNGATDSTMPVYKVNLANVAPVSVRSLEKLSLENLHLLF